MKIWEWEIWNISVRTYERLTMLYTLPLLAFVFVVMINYFQGNDIQWVMPWRWVVAYALFVAIVMNTINIYFNVICTQDRAVTIPERELS